ncbi:MAG: hypothetical protein ACM335_12915 [Deltaproteobacteria bacterium]
MESLNTGKGLADVVQGKVGAGARSLKAFPRLNRLSSASRVQTIASV